ncbi:MAG TPA: 16S rRNA (cytosine(1402)-N(4))-methyltransferase RsmH [Candidatus Paceibacterota bacterium]|jgi:S-adenosyl-methyltransferase MraW
MHESVLLQETIDGLELRDGDVVVDGTLGRAGHSIEMVKRVKVRLIGIDRDAQAIEESRAKLSAAGANFELHQGNFADMKSILAYAGVEHVNKVILDLGVSSPQIDSSGRGFSFKENEPLSMTMEREPSADAFTARDIVNGWAEEDIANVIYAYGEERYARRIARGIVTAREIAPIETTHQLVEIIQRSVPFMYRHGRIHPATRTFQALRIAVNDELRSIERGLDATLSVLQPEGRIAVISFHSLEDRIVKERFRKWEGEGTGKQATKKPIVPSEAEIERNPRSRSAKLRIFIRR